MYDMPDIAQASEFLGMSPVDFLNDMGLMKASNKKNTPGSGGGRPNAVRGFDEFGSYTLSAKGIKENYPPIPANILRETERKNPIISACTNLRIRQMRQFARVSSNDDDPGFRIMLKDTEAKPSNKDTDEMKRIADWFLNTGKTDFDGWDEREDSFLDAITKLVREILIIDQIAIEVRRDKGNNIVDFWVMDAATIKRVDRGGFIGTKDDINPESALSVNNNFYKKLTQERRDLIPNFEDIRFVQEIQGRYVAAFTRKDLIFATFNKRTDIRYTHYGYSNVEQAIAAITAFMYALAYNASQFNQGTLPKIAMVFV